MQLPCCCRIYEVRSTNSIETPLPCLASLIVFVAFEYVNHKQNDAKSPSSSGQINCLLSSPKQSNSSNHRHEFSRHNEHLMKSRLMRSKPHHHKSLSLSITPWTALGCSIGSNRTSFTTIFSSKKTSISSASAIARSDETR